MSGVVLLLDMGMYRVLVVVVCLLLQGTDVVHGADPAPGTSCAARTVPPELHLLRCLMADYDVAVRPVVKHNDTVMASVRMLLIKINDLVAEEVEFWAPSSSCGVQTVPPELCLLRCLMADYDMAVRPVAKHNDTIMASVRMLLIKINDLNEHKHTLDTTAWIHMSWVDHQLKWKPEDYGGVDVLRIPVDRLWTPDLVLYNNAGDSYEYVVDKLAEVRHDGRVTWVPHARLHAYCNLDLKMFPFDEQKCVLSFGSWTYDITKLNFSIPPHPERKHVYDGHEWRITSYTVTRQQWSYGTDGSMTETYPVITLHISLKRQGAFYVNVLVLPSVLFALLVAFIFLVPFNSGQRLPYAIGLLICQTFLLMVLENFVPTEIGDLPLLGVHVLMQMVMLTIGIIFSVAILNFYHRDVRKNKVPTWLRSLLLGKLSRVLCLKPDMYTSLPTDLSVVNGVSSELRTADELGLDSSSSGLHPATMDGTLEDIRRYLKTLAARAADPVSTAPPAGFPSHQELVVQEWRQVALVLDRILFVIYLTFTVIVTAGLFSH